MSLHLYVNLLCANSDYVCIFSSGKDGADDLFDKLDTSKLNAHLKGLMPGLTAKVFRTYNASITLDDMVRYRLKLLVGGQTFSPR